VNQSIWRQTRRGKKELYNAKTVLHKYRPGDLVWYLKEMREKGICTKLQLPYSGPYVIVKKLTDLDYRIQFDARGKQKTIHHNKLEPYQGEAELTWAREAVRDARRQENSEER
jgi:hypothetical protein